jgi:hypothetical protein
MNVNQDHVIHSRAGRLGADGVTSRADAKRIIAQAHAANPDKGLLIHFHGGLVNTAAGLAIAANLAPRYFSAGAYPLFFVWEAGPIQTLKNNLGDILNDEVFQELVKKVGEWAVKQIGGAFTTRGGGAIQIDQYKMRHDFDSWFAGAAAAPPVPLDSPVEKPGATKAVLPNEDTLATDIESELPNDERFQRVMAGLYVASGGGAGTTTKSGGPPAVTVRALVDEKALDQMFLPRTSGNTRAGLVWFKVAKFVAKVVIAVVKRHWDKRDHGIYTTIVEEVLRAAYLAKVGEVVWRTMKKDTADAFDTVADSVGTALFADLAELAAQGKTFKQITLVGHSTGAVYINNLLEHAAALPDTKFNVILLAPACRSDAFAKVAAANGARIANFRMFTMSDELESQDQLVSIIYPRSLLYFISGVLEGAADVPILGMNRFNVNEDLFSSGEFEYVAAVRTWLGKNASNCVWSIADGGLGLNCTSKSHGDFDNDDATLLSIEHVISSGY